MRAPSQRFFARLVLTMVVLSAPGAVLSPVAAQDDVALSVQIAPPELPDYEQPPMPESGYLWTPGYWSWNQATGYYWVPGTWVLPPGSGMLWTPPYWGWGGGGYAFHAGYWGPHVGYYGGVNYGYGYGGSGYQGGRWRDGALAYNRNANNFGGVSVTNVYQERVVISNRNNLSHAGGPDGLRGRPNAAQNSAAREPHLPDTSDQQRHRDAAAVHPGLVATHEHGQPAIAATQRPAQFEGAGVVQPRQSQPIAHQQAVARQMPPPQTRPQPRPAPPPVEHERHGEQGHETRPHP